MDKMIVKPLEEVNDVKFGMTREDVRKYFGEAKEFKKSKFSKVTTDDFGFCHVFYNVEDRCEAIEIFVGVDVFIGDKKIFPTTIENAKKMFGDLIEESGSFISKENSVGIYVLDGKMESILFGEEGYYE